MANAITRLITLLRGQLVGTDEAGNKYYQDRKAPSSGRRRRWVVYARGDDASQVPPDFHAWLHYTVDAFPNGKTAKHKPWQKEHLPNLSGTPFAYRPPGHTLKGGHRAKATGDYEAWQPE